MKSILITMFTFLMVNLGSAQTTFSEVGEEVGVDTEYLNLLSLGGGVAFFDFNQDGWEDVWVARGLQPDKLYQNNGDGTFTDVSNLIIFFAGVNTMGVVTGDVNNDGFRDVLMMTLIGVPNKLLMNNGDGTFTDISSTAGLLDHTALSMGATFGDVNQDGLLDFYVSNYVYNPVTITDSTGAVVSVAHECDINWLFINQGLDENNVPRFEITTDPAFTADAGCTLAATFSDFDSDLDPDILVINDFGEWIIPNRLLLNNGPDNDFSDVTASTNMGAHMNGMGVAIGDYDQDNDLDYYATDVGANDLFQNQGDATFIDKTIEAGVEDTFEDDLYTLGWGTFFADMDNDTDLDLFVSNGFSVITSLPIQGNESNPNRLYLNQLADSQQATFIEYATEAGVDDAKKGRGCAYADFDHDGDLDYVVVNSNSGGGAVEQVLFYRNELDNNNNWLQVKLIGQTTNRDAYGTQMRIVVGDKSWRVEIDGGSSHTSQNSSVAHFGLGAAAQADSLIIYWPGSQTEVFTNLTANQRINITEGQTLTNVWSPVQSELHLSATPNPFRNATSITYELPEATTVKFNIYTMTGQLVEVYTFDKAQGAHQFTWKNNDLPQGIYLLRLQTADGQEQSIKITKG